MRAWGCRHLRIFSSGAGVRATGALATAPLWECRWLRAEMNEWLDILYRYCGEVLSGDSASIAQLRTAGFDCSAGQWSFCLPALHAWLANLTPTQAPLDYPAFLKQLYASDFNERLARQGAQIVIADNRGQVSESLYRLQRLS